MNVTSAMTHSPLSRVVNTIKHIPCPVQKSRMPLFYSPTGEPYITLPSPHDNIILTPPRTIPNPNGIDAEPLIPEADLSAITTNLNDPRIYLFLEGPPVPYTRGNVNGTDLNRQMPTVGRIDVERNPLEEPEMRAGHRFMHDVAAAGVGEKMAYGADVHGELTRVALLRAAARLEAV